MLHNKQNQLGELELKKSTESIDAVTQCLRLCLAAAIEAILSISANNFPPKKCLVII